MTHLRIETLGCGVIIAPIEHITVHSVGGTRRLLCRDDVEWREISDATYQYLMGVIEYG